MDDLEIVLEPCPFCDSEEIVEWDNITKQPAPNHMMCAHCFAGGPDEKSTEEAIFSWNRRARR